jgi:hypothetical protein
MNLDEKAEENSFFFVMLNFGNTLITGMFRKKGTNHFSIIWELKEEIAWPNA